MCNQIIINDILSPFFINLISSLSENAKILFVALFIGPNGFCLLNVNFYQSEVYTLFKENGFLHLFAISGSNLILLSMFLEKALKPLKVFIRTGWVRIALLILYVTFMVGLDVIPAARALLTEFVSFILKSFGLKTEYKYITILLFLMFLIIRVGNIINMSFMLTFGILLVSLVSVELFLKIKGLNIKNDSFISKYFYESIFTLFYPLLIIKGINLSFSQIFFSLIIKEILDVLAVLNYLLIFTFTLLRDVLSPVINLLVEFLLNVLKTINLNLLKLEYSNYLFVFSVVAIVILLLASVRKFVRESYLDKYVPVAQLDRARHS